MILLDTCALLWLAADQGKLSNKAKKTIEKNAGALFISAISAFEIAVKARNGKLKFPFTPLRWYDETISFHGISELPVTGEIACAAVELPSLHNDPCDRIIIATSKIHEFAILTCDHLIGQYKQADVIW